MNNDTLSKKSSLKRYQMADIARLAGVSVSTVSRALNSSHLVNEETRQRIEELAGSLNYTINIAAKNLRLGENNTMAVVIPRDTKNKQQISDPFFLNMLGNLADVLTDRGYEMLLARVDADHLDEAAGLFTSGRTRGVIVIGQWKHHDQLNELASRKIPMAVWGANLPGSLYPTVGGDNVRGGYIATKHLIEEGCRRILFMGDRQLPEVQKRFEGYCDALADCGLTFEEALCFDTPFIHSAARVSVENALDQRLAFDGIFACSDLLAMSAIRTLVSHGKKVPKDVRVVGYDDIPMASYFYPPLTSVRQPLSEASIALVDCLEAATRHMVPSTTILPASLVIRESA